MRKTIFFKVFSALSLCLSSAIAGESSWQGIKVDVKANQPVQTTQSLSAQKDGFQRLAISISNPGKQTLVIEKINIHVPIAEQLSDDMQIVYGGSCMGRTPMLRQTLNEKNKNSSSHMYEMLRLNDKDYLLAGSLSWRIFLPNFTYKDKSLVIWSDGEGKQLKPGESLSYEQIVLKKSESWMDLLDQLGSAVATENGIANLKPANYKGWATWDYYGRVFIDKDIYGNMDQLNKLAPEANMVQIDGGWWTERGDYQSIRPDLLPGGIKSIVSRIVAEGKTAGLHFDGFRGDAAAEICKTHPEYFLHDQDGKMIVTLSPKTDKVMNYTYFDYSHPGARAHIAECIKTMKEWGITYFKVDFMRYGLENDIKLKHKDLKSIKAHDNSITGVERFRLGMKTMREAMGPEAYFLGCSAVFGPCIGFVDGMRTGGDIHPRYEAFPERCLANLSNYYLSGKVFNGDADYLVFREAIDEDDTVSKEEHKYGGKMALNEAQMWADFNKIYGTCRLNSDNLKTLRSERKSLVKDVFNYTAMVETVPLDFWNHGKTKDDGFELILARSKQDIYLGVFNWSDKEKSYDISAFGTSKPVLLQARHSVILKYEGKETFETLTRQLQAN